MVEEVKEEVKIEIRCENESQVVGTINVPLDQGKRGVLLSSRFMWGGFQPVTEEYRLPRKMTGDGHVLRCPRCQGILCIAGDNATLKAETDDVIHNREEARRRIIDQAKLDGETHVYIDARGIDPGLVPITLGKMRIEAK